MREVQEAAAQGLWEQALVELACLASSVTLASWESDRDHANFTGQVEHFVDAFQDSDPPSLNDIERSPLACLVALDRLAALERRALRASRPYRAANGSEHWLLRVATPGRGSVPLARAC